MHVKARYVAMPMVLAILGGCATRPPLELTKPVGPANAPTAALNQGRLVVYSLEYFGSMDADIERYVHSSYTIYDADGKEVRTVDNQTGLFNGDPETVRLPVGHYHVKAQANGVGWVSVPVVIERSQTTVVDLNGEWWSDHALADQAVKLPNGSVIGAEAQPAPAP